MPWWQIFWVRYFYSFKALVETPFEITAFLENTNNNSKAQHRGVLINFSFDYI
jgi:hypothetical protein